MSFMKKFISSFIVLILLCLLTSCNKQQIYLFENEYNLINQNLEVIFYTNTLDSPYMKKENVLNCFICNKDNILNVNLLDIVYLGEEENKYKYQYVFDMESFKNEYLVLNDVNLKVEYVNNKEMTYRLGSIASINMGLSNDISLKKLKGVYEDYLKGIVFDLENNTQKNIKIVDLMLINANFGADLVNLMQIDDDNGQIDKFLLNYDPYQNPTCLVNDVTILSGETLSFFLPVCYEKKIFGSQTAILIIYEMGGIIKTKGIYNFLLANNIEHNNTLGVYDVENRD